MDDGVVGGAWSIDPETRTALRLGKIRSAVRECAWNEAILEAEELLDEHPDHPEALFLLGEALLEIGDWELALEVYEQRVALDGGDAESLVGLAISSFHMCDLPGAAAAAREAVRRDPGNAEAHHTLGLALERTPGRQAEALTELTAAAHLDPARFPLPLRLRPSDWEGLITKAVSTLPPRIQAFYAQIPFRVEDLPEMDDLKATYPPLSPTVGALYVGTPPDNDDPFEVRPDAVRLFERNLARAGTMDAITAELANALHDEALDWLGEDPEA